MEEQLSKDLAKELIDIDSKIPNLKNNDRAVAGIKEFTSNSHIDRLCIFNTNPIMKSYVIEYIKKTALSSFYLYENSQSYNTLGSSSIVDFMRKSIILTIKTSTDTYEGELTDSKFFKNDLGVVEHIDLSLKTAKGSKTITLSSVYYDIVANINIGDYIYIEPNVGIVKRIGRCETRANEFDLEGDKYVQLSKNAVHNHKEKEINLSLFDLDYAYNNYSENISDFTRIQVDKSVKDYIAKGIAKFNPSVICIEEMGLLTDQELRHIGYLIENVKKVKVVGFFDKAHENSAFQANGFLDDYFTIKNISNESISDIIQYFSAKQISPEILAEIQIKASYDNFSKVLNILEMSETASEFLDLCSSQCI